MIVIIGYNHAWNAVYTAEFHNPENIRQPGAVPGMAWGVRNDIANGKRGIIANWCASDSSVCYWEVKED